MAYQRMVLTFSDPKNGIPTYGADILRTKMTGAENVSTTKKILKLQLKIIYF
jgi:hypothetical protein